MKRIIATVLILALSVGIGYGAQELEKYLRYKAHPLEYTEFVERYSEEFEIPIEMLYAVIKCESSFDSTAVSSVGATGLMQLMPRTLEDMMRRCGEQYDERLLYDPETNIRYGSYYLRYLYNIFQDWDVVLAAYNGGMGNVRSWLKDSEYYDGAKLIKYPEGFEETENYVKKVNKAEATYRELYFDTEEQ